MLELSLTEEHELHQQISWGVIYASIPVFLILLFVVPSPWGKTSNAALLNVLGPPLPARLAWFVFEIPNLIWIAVALCNLKHELPLINRLLLTFFVMHYFNRAILYPFWMSNRAKQVPLMVVLSACLYCCING